MYSRSHWVKTRYRWLSARLQYLQCISTGDTWVLHWPINMISIIMNCYDATVMMLIWKAYQSVILWYIGSHNFALQWNLCHNMIFHVMGQWQGTLSWCSWCERNEMNMWQITHKVYFLPGLVYLIFRNETKRALLPNEITTMDTVRALFVRSFPDVLSMQYLDGPYRKIYIMDSQTHLYYELEDFKWVLLLFQYSTSKYWLISYTKGK